MSEDTLTRRAVARGMVVAAVSAGGTAVFTACAGGDDTDRGGDDGAADDHTGGEPTGGGARLADTKDIPEGGGKVFADQEVVVTQPSAGEFTAFSAVCTHAGCAVRDVSDGTINCHCHGSRFSIEDGSPTAGPAQAPLPRTRISVRNDTVWLA